MNEQQQQQQEQYVIRVLGDAEEFFPPEASPVYFESWSGEGRPIVTTIPDAARRFASAAVALEEYRRIDPHVPLRQDGRPNRPMTAWTVEICPVSRMGDRLFDPAID